MIISIIATLLCVVGGLLQLAVLRDKSIPEGSLQDHYRALRVGMYALLALVAHTLPPAAAFAVGGLALADAMSAVSRLFPEEGADA